MPVALGADLILILAFLVSFAIVYTFRVAMANTIVAALRAIPIVGGRIGDSVDNALKAAQDRLWDWTQAMAHTTIDWLKALADISGDFYDQVKNFANGYVAQMDALVTVKIPAMIRARLAPIVQAVNAVTVVAGDAAHSIGTFRDWFDNTFIPRLNTRIDQLSRGIDHLKDDLVPALDQRLTNGIDRLRDVLAKDVQPRVKALEQEIVAAKTRLQGIDVELTDLKSWVGPIASVFGAAAIVSLLKHLFECRPKTERLCVLEPQYFDELLGLALILPHLGEIQNVVRESALLVAGIADEFAESLRD